MPDVPRPETLPSFVELRERWIAEVGNVGPQLREAMMRPLALDFRAVEPGNPLRPEISPPIQHVWFKTVAPLPANPMLHRCLLAYATDFNLVGTALRPHGQHWYSGRVVVASIDHALWFHRETRVDEWLLYCMDSPTAQGGRGLARGLIYDASGRLVASVAQEGMMRMARAT
jgi:acyl-CoA thioesterase-2